MRLPGNYQAASVRFFREQPTGMGDLSQFAHLSVTIPGPIMVTLWLPLHSFSRPGSHLHGSTAAPSSYAREVGSGHARHHCLSPRLKLNAFFHDNASDQILLELSKQVIDGVWHNFRVLAVLCLLQHILSDKKLWF
uniref:Uncharacterized protein n=1 Tax=Arundo donax TaxID=35708 RepID=A0A0A9GBW3_ARUDO